MPSFGGAIGTSAASPVSNEGVAAAVAVAAAALHHPSLTHASLPLSVSQWGTPTRISRDIGSASSHPSVAATDAVPHDGARAREYAIGR